MSRKKPPTNTKSEAEAPLTAKAVQHDFEISYDRFHEFRRPDGATQFGLRVESRTDPEGRFLVLVTWPDAASVEPRYCCICPPGREANAGAVVLGTRLILVKQAYELGKAFSPDGGAA